ncbi:MAG: glycogen-binding domain-containing protein [Candidatus Krumholzibacteriales bacterium]
MVTFRVRIQSARTVQVAGDWNNWGAGDGAQGEVLAGLMEKSADGSHWEKTVKLPAGRYKYIFVVNESIRILDGRNPRVVPDGKGGKANLLILPGL